MSFGKQASELLVSLTKSCIILAILTNKKSHKNDSTMTIQKNSSPTLKCNAAKSGAARCDKTALYTYADMPVIQLKIGIGCSNKYAPSLMWIQSTSLFLREIFFLQ